MEPVKMSLWVLAFALLTMTCIYAIILGHNPIKVSVTASEPGLHNTSERYLSVALDSSLVRLKWATFNFSTKSEGNGGDWINVTVDPTKSISVISDRFLSIALGSTLIKDRWRSFDFRSPLLQTLVGALSPCYLRLGGTEADFLIFDPEVTKSSTWWENDALPKRQPWEREDYYKATKHKDFHNFTMSASDWDNINTFAHNVGCRLLFDFNVLLRNGSGWDSSNAESLLRYSVKKGYADNLDFELGNEPNAFHHLLNITIDPHQYGRDVLQLADLLHRTEFKGRFNASILVGPDTSDNTKKHSRQFIKQFLSVTSDVVSAVTWHQYYVNGRIATLDNFTDPGVLDLFPKEVKMVRKVVEQSKASGIPMWMGETGSAYGGGAEGLSDTYAAGFMWLDKLGIAAREGLEVVIRQSLYGGKYGLIDKNLQPLPDYWLSLLYKKLVGTGVLSVTSSDKSGYLRQYAHCTSDKTDYPPGSVTLYGINLHPTHVTLNFTSALSRSHVLEFLLTPHGSSGLKSKHVNLNGKKLKMINDTTFPSLTPVTYDPGKVITLPEFSFAFYVFPEAKLQTCML